MANVRVEQRNAHLAGPVRLETVAGRDGDIGKAVLTAISNSKRGRGESREDELTAVQWTLWGKQAENAAQYLQNSKIHAIGGSWMAKRQMIADSKFKEITRMAKKASNLVKQIRA